MPLIGGWITGAYCFRNLVNGKVYVGGAYRSFEQRRSNHVSCLRGGYHGNRHFQFAWNKYGEKNFSFEILEKCHPDRVLECEQKWIDHHHAADRRFGYNVCPKAESNLGREVSEDTKRKLAEVMTRPGVLERLIDASRTPEALEKRRQSLKGKCFKTAEHRAKLSIALVGRKVPSDIVEKSASKRRGRKRPDSFRKKMSESMKGNKNGKGKLGRKYGPISDEGYLKKYGRPRP